MFKGVFTFLANEGIIPCHWGHPRPHHVSGVFRNFGSAFRCYSQKEDAAYLGAFSVALALWFFMSSGDGSGRLALKRQQGGMEQFGGSIESPSGSSKDLGDEKSRRYSSNSLRSSSSTEERFLTKIFLSQNSAFENSKATSKLKQYWNSFYNMMRFDEPKSYRDSYYRKFTIEDYDAIKLTGRYPQRYYNMERDSRFVY